MFLIGYNLIRTGQFDAAQVSEARLEQLSFKSAWCASGCGALGSGMASNWWRGCSGYPGMLSDLSRDRNPNRPGRYEPRVVKRRPKPLSPHAAATTGLAEKVLTA